MNLLPGDVLVHRACGKPAIRARAPCNYGDAIKAEMFEHIDGRPAQDYEEIRCDSCGAPYEMNLRSVDVQRAEPET